MRQDSDGVGKLCRGRLAAQLPCPATAGHSPYVPGSAIDALDARGILAVQKLFHALLIRLVSYRAKNDAGCREG
jgi:hypothetical protein